MNPADIRIGMRVRSISNSFTKGMAGVVKELGRGGDRDEPAAFILFDAGPTFAVAVRLLEPEAPS